MGINKKFNEKELDKIREIAIKLYVNDGTFKTVQDILRLQVIAEATKIFLKQQGKIKDEN